MLAVPKFLTFRNPGLTAGHQGSSKRAPNGHPSTPGPWTPPCPALSLQAHSPPSPASALQQRPHGKGPDVAGPLTRRSAAADKAVIRGTGDGEPADRGHAAGLGRGAPLPCRVHGAGVNFTRRHFPRRSNRSGPLRGCGAAGDPDVWRGAGDGGAGQET